MTAGLHNVSNAALSDLALRQSSKNAEQIAALRRPCRFCGHCEAAYKQFYCGDDCRFWSKVRRGPFCWEWTASRFGGRKGKTYGQFTIKRDGVQLHIGAHQYIYELTHGPVPDGLEIRHLCHNPICVRPDHITVGTHTQNVHDAMHAGHLNIPHEKSRKLTDEQVEEIVAYVHAQPRGGATRAAKQYGVTKQYVGMLVRGTRRTGGKPGTPLGAHRGPYERKEHRAGPPSPAHVSVSDLASAAGGRS